MTGQPVSQAAIEWLASGERGVSSNTIFQHLTGLLATGGLLSHRGGHPHDPADLRRCMLLLERCPELASRIDEMCFVSPEWNALASNWKQITEAFIAEAEPQGGWRNGNWRCPVTYRLMRTLIESARSAA